MRDGKRKFCESVLNPHEKGLCTNKRRPSLLHSTAMATSLRPIADIDTSLYCVVIYTILYYCTSQYIVNRKRTQYWRNTYVEIVPPIRSTLKLKYSISKALMTYETTHATLRVLFHHPEPINQAELIH